ncbi:hypothetical protein NOCA2140039 [metagenome]|uniref:Uncharacterized protein n=1 Tax=metagenome TaxID=256318 RepID=A0A2P2BWT6_9ZZZZ
MDADWEAQGSIELGFDARPMVPLYAKISGSVVRSWGTRSAEALDEALTRVDLETLQRRVEESEEFSALVGRAMQAAGDSLLQDKRRLLGRLIAEATLDDALIDDNIIWVDILASIDAPHVRCMEAVRRAEQEAAASGEQEPVAEASEKPYVRRIQDAANGYPSPIIRTLSNLGLIQGTVNWDESSRVTGMTRHGERLLSYLREGNS